MREPSEEPPLALGELSDLEMDEDTVTLAGVESVSTKHKAMPVGSNTATTSAQQTLALLREHQQQRPSSTLYGAVRLPRLEAMESMAIMQAVVGHQQQHQQGFKGAAWVAEGGAADGAVAMISYNTAKVGVSCVKGRRVYMEDEASCLESLEAACPSEHHKPTVRTAFWAVFDGHAGGRCSKALCQGLAASVARDPEFHADLRGAIYRGFQRANTDFLKRADKLQMNDGSTAVTVFARNGRLWVANVGDSRAVLSAKGKAVPLSVDHKPNRPEERRRIAALGGKVVNCFGVARVNGVLAVARAFGNRSMRSVIRPDPEVLER
jgi:serine/threonine protein phosphatase PrpC